MLAGEEPSGGGKATLIRPKGIVERGTSAYYPTAPEWLPATVGSIRREFCKGISATDVFRMVGLSHTIVEKAFRRHLRTTVQQEIMRHRLNGAIELLCTTSLTSAEISRRTGFSSPQYFARFFLEQTKCTPGGFRERNSGPAWERHTIPSAMERRLLDPADQAVER